MKFCQRHWGVLRAAIESHGLQPLCADNAIEVARRMAAWSQGLVLKMNYDPLMSAHMEVVRQAINRWGGEVIREDRCPSCRLFHELKVDGERAAHAAVTKQLEDAIVNEWKFVVQKGWLPIKISNGHGA